MRWLRVVALTTTVVGALVLLPQHVRSLHADSDLARVRAEWTHVQRENERLAAEIALLAAQTHALREDRMELRRIARTDARLVAPGEVVFELRTKTARTR